MSLHRLLEIEIGVPEPDTLNTFYQEIGFVGAPGSWGSEDAPDQIKVADATYRQLRSIRVACQGEADLAAISGRLDDLGVAFASANGQLSVIDPINAWQYMVEVAPVFQMPLHAQRLVNFPGQLNRMGARAEVIVETEPRKPRRLGHVVVGTPEPQKTVALCQALGFRISDVVMGGIATFMRCSSDHHNLLVAPGPVPYLNHYAIEQDDFDSVMKAATHYLGSRSEDRQVAGPGRHQIGGNIFWYMLDPSGNIFEFFTDMDQIVDDDAWEVQDWGPENSWSVWGEQQQPEAFFAPADLPAIIEGWNHAHS